MHTFLLNPRQQSLSSSALSEAMQAFEDTGLVLIEGAYSKRRTRELREACLAELATSLASRGGLEAINRNAFGQNHVGMFPPMRKPFSDVDVVAHPVAVQLMQLILGPEFTCCFYHTNTAYPGSGTQHIHRDTGTLFGVPRAAYHPTVSLVVNVPLCDFTEENGSTEIWPCTHLIPNDGRESPEVLLQRSRVLPSIRANMPAGSLLLRDLRLWHRGVPNRSAEPRPMLAIVYTRPWLAEKPMDITKETWDTWPDHVRSIFRRNKVV